MSPASRELTRARKIEMVFITAPPSGLLSGYTCVTIRVYKRTLNPCKILPESNKRDPEPTEFLEKISKVSVAH
jgi:hypothetical protein